MHRKAFRKARRGLLLYPFALTAMVVLLCGLFVPPASACGGCSPGDVPGAEAIISANHAKGRTDINTHTSKEFTRLRNWWTTVFLREQVVPALQRFTEQMSAVAMHQTMIIGTFLDAKNQLETQRLFQELQVQAHKDYQPSTSFCAFGTNVRSLAHSEAVGRYNALALSRRQMARHLGQVSMAGARDASDDKRARWQQFVEHYCDPWDNFREVGKANTGLSSICRAPAEPDRVNLDIDYTRLIENRRTLEMSFPNFNGAPDELDVMSLGNNLYGHDILFREINEDNIKDPDMSHLYLSLRAVAAKRSVAENSFNAIVGMKTLGSAGGALDVVTGPTNTSEFLGAILRELGIPEAEIAEYFGLKRYAPGDIVDPSYYAQLEILAKKIYQNPDFYANLYDTPANVERKSAALKAIDLMLDRAIYESQIRQEMSLSVLLSSKLNASFEDINKNLGTE
ncbi:MAG: hypothetical protein IT559_08530 [Alphaproteobacteria bacterium]|nr:hypothetical protein [Alphaproteobacteria bacterium]